MSELKRQQKIICILDSKKTLKAFAFGISASKLPALLCSSVMSVFYGMYI
jgi:hypothetical protein